VRCRKRAVGVFSTLVSSETAASVGMDMSSCIVLGMALLMVELDEEDVRPLCGSGRDDVVDVRVAGTEDRCTRF